MNEAIILEQQTHSFLPETYPGLEKNEILKVFAFIFNTHYCFHKILIETET